MAKYAYCNVCKKQVEHLVRKPMETFHKVVWIIVIIATAGIAAIIYAIVYSNRRKEYCSTCQTKVQFSSEPFETEEEEGIPLTPKEKILKKAGKDTKPKMETDDVKEKPDEEKKPKHIFCPYCGEDIKPDAEKCPYCNSDLKTPY